MEENSFRVAVAQLLQNSPPFTEPECLLEYPQEPATGPYTEPQDSSSQPYTISLSLNAPQSDNS